MPVTTYDFFVIGDLDPARLATALATMTTVEVGAVDVLDADEQDNRNWIASVSCMYTPMRGDVSWMLDIYLTDAVPRHPEEPAAATYLAEALNTAVLYPALLPLSSAYWLAAPGGLLTRARLHSVADSADDQIAYQIKAVAAPVPQLPSVPIDRQPEVIREHRVPAPITDELYRWLETWQTTTTIPAEVAGLLWQTRTRLDAWENLAARMSVGWPPDGWYPATFYAEDLRTRDELAAALRRLPATAAEKFGAALRQIDAMFRQLTEAAPHPPEGEPSGADWWWHRIPNPLPWADAPDS